MRRLHDSFPLEGLHNGGSIHAAHFPQKAGALQQSDVFTTVEPVFAGRTPRSGEPQPFPHPNDCGRKAHHARYVTNFQTIVITGGVHTDQQLAAGRIKFLLEIPVSCLLTLPNYSKVCKREFLSQPGRSPDNLEASMYSPTVRRAS